MKLGALGAGLQTWLRKAVAALLSAFAWLVALILGGFAAIVVGIYLVAGLGWSLIFGGLILLIGASFIVIGISRG